MNTFSVHLNRVPPCGLLAQHPPFDADAFNVEAGIKCTPRRHILETELSINSRKDHP